MEAKQARLSCSDPRTSELFRAFRQLYSARANAIASKRILFKLSRRYTDEKTWRVTRRSLNTLRNSNVTRFHRSKCRGKSAQRCVELSRLSKLRARLERITVMWTFMKIRCALCSKRMLPVGEVFATTTVAAHVRIRNHIGEIALGREVRAECQGIPPLLLRTTARVFPAMQTLISKFTWRGRGWLCERFSVNYQRHYRSNGT